MAKEILAAGADNGLSVYTQSGRRDIAAKCFVLPATFRIICGRKELADELVLDAPRPRLQSTPATLDVDGSRRK